MENSSSDSPPPLPPPPPPPPPLPTLISSQSKLSSDGSVHPPIPPNFSPNEETSKEIYTAAISVKLQQSADLFIPCYMFFYGSLMDNEVLQAVLGLRETPSIMKGNIKGFSVKMCGIYPTIIRDKEGKIYGTAWKVDLESHFLLLQEYETDAYTWCLCDIELEGGEILYRCRTFCWAGDANSCELDDGFFDLVRYQKYFKSSVVRK